MFVIFVICLFFRYFLWKLFAFLESVWGLQILFMFHFEIRITKHLHFSKNMEYKKVRHLKTARNFQEMFSNLNAAFYSYIFLNRDVQVVVLGVVANGSFLVSVVVGPSLGTRCWISTFFCRAEKETKQRRVGGPAQSCIKPVRWVADMPLLGPPARQIPVNCSQGLI